MLLQKEIGPLNLHLKITFLAPGIVSCILLCGGNWLAPFLVRTKVFLRTIWLLISSPVAVQFAGSSFASLATKEKVKVTD